MFRILLKKYIHESLLLWSACAFMLFLFPWVRIWTVSQFELSGFAPLMDQIRNLEKFSPVPLEQFLTYEGVIGLTFDEPILILCILVWSISRGSDVISGEIGRGTMEMLMAQPTSRIKVLSAHATITIIGLLLLVVIAYAGLCMGIVTNSVPVTIEPERIQVPGLPFSLRNPFGGEAEKTFQPLLEFVSLELFIVPTIHLFALGYVVLGLSVFFSSMDHFRWRTIGIVISVYVLQLLLFILAKSTKWLDSLKSFSFLSAYQPDWTIRVIKRDSSSAWSLLLDENDVTMIGPLGFPLILILLGSLLYGIGFWIFSRRDLPAPL